MAEEASASEKTGEPRVPMHVELHSLSKHAQLQNGLRYQDYQRYHAYCTKRLGRLRKRKDVRFTFGRGKTFVKRELTVEVATTDAHIQIALMMAERAWAHAMQLKQGAVTASYRVTHHLVSRFKKAVKWAALLETLCAELCDERTGLEASAYSAWMAGNLALELEHWSTALEKLSTAHRICQELGQVGSLEDQDLFGQRAEEIAPSLRYCRYNLGQEDCAAVEEGSRAGDGLLASKLESVLVASRKQQAKTLDHVSWRGQEVPVTVEELRVAIVSIRETAAALAKLNEQPQQQQEAKLESAYLSLFSACSDAEKLISGEQKKLVGKAGGAGSKLEAQRSAYGLLLAFVEHQRLSATVVRNEALALALQSSPEEHSADLVHVYDTLLQTVRGVRQCLTTGSGDDMLEELEDDEVLMAAADELRFRAFRCKYLAEAYSTDNQWLQAEALFDRSQQLSQAALEKLEELETDAPVEDRKSQL
ncbi:unnamed protein product, partial [Chrysoparadoxa australica]